MNSCHMSIEYQINFQSTNSDEFSVYPAEELLRILKSYFFYLKNSENTLNSAQITAEIKTNNTKINLFLNL